MSNRNTLWASVFVDELARSGLRAVCIAPGSRSTALTLAFAKHEAIKVYTHLDERSAGFFALGMALASDEPVALVCTSGTAAANFFPAIVEAHMSRVPLIVITADRPPELRYSGANQTIDQVKIYGDQVLWSVDVGLPEANPPAIAIRNLRTLAARAYAKANGIRKGVVHINMPFRKPLEPTEIEGDVVEVPPEAEARQLAPLWKPEKAAPFTQTWSLNRLVDPVPRNSLVKIIEEHERGLIVCGTSCPRFLDLYRDVAMLSPHNFSDEVLTLGQVSKYPIIADALSFVRFRSYLTESILGGYENYLFPNTAPKDVDVIIRFGNLPLSKQFNQYLSALNLKYYVYIDSNGEWSDDEHRLTHFFQAQEGEICRQVFEALKDDDPGPVLNREATTLGMRLAALEIGTWETINNQIASGDYFDGAAVYDVVDLIPPDSTLFVGNSLPVRLLDQFGKPQNKRIYVYANRGASGIDGNISTALGAGASRPDQPLVAIVGDITFYHDMNGLLAVERNGIPVTIVLLNNNGGGIFHRLPIKKFEPEFTDLFVMPHGLEFEHAAKMYGLEYVRADDRQSFRQAFSESVNKRLSRIIEVRTDALHDLQRRQAIMDAVQARIKALDL